ncbi:MAG: tRNA (adenosine(37)-N6)-threonylcarbamoyltransferase complex ATPase subunit type 1 TsaE [Rhizobiaceae bacterium]|nr:tRNA (adenosine(37)-N6)-threonylcarbamoyltransferase complex ATPase subunit type 1 TsaE [Rhizobiaceae bacterium]
MGEVIYKLNNENETRNLAADMALAARKGDLITLSGELGAGKTLFARAFIQNYLGSMEFEVPSPTYVMAIEYGDDSAGHVTHMDLYRISNPTELDELGLDNALESGVVLIEWPQRAANLISSDRLELTFDIQNETVREVTVSGAANMVARYQRSLEIGDFLQKNWAGDFTRKPFAADASARNYELVVNGNETRILMDAPKAADGPVIKNGQTYSQIAHLAEEVRPFVAIANLLRGKGFCAPQIYASDYDNGLVLLEHLGEGKITDKNNQPIAQRYIDSGMLLAQMHQVDWPASVVMDDGEAFQIPGFDEQAMMIEVQLLSDWYLQDFNDLNVADDDIHEFNRIWSDYCRRAQDFEQSIVLRDYHSPNIIWRESETLAGRVGLIDFQDAMTGPAAYDVASLAQDARVVVTPELEAEIIAKYLEVRLKQDVEFSAEKFEFEYAMMTTQRATKLLGIFARLCKRDGKPQYRKLIPAVRNYLKRNLQHPQLSEYREWCERVIKL